jgi:hypothetical protein
VRQECPNEDRCFEAEKRVRRSFEALQDEHEITFSDERLTEENADPFADAGSSPPSSSPAPSRAC